HVKESSLERGVREPKAEEIAARTVNKRRRIEGRTPNSRTQGTGNPNRPLEERSRDEVYNRARELEISGRSKMSKAELVEAVRHEAKLAGYSHRRDRTHWVVDILEWTRQQPRTSPGTGSRAGLPTRGSVRPFQPRCPARPGGRGRTARYAHRQPARTVPGCSDRGLARFDERIGKQPRCRRPQTYDRRRRGGGRQSDRRPPWQLWCGISPGGAL